MLQQIVEPWQMVLWHVSVKVFLFPYLTDGLRTCQNVFTSFPSGTLEPHLSALLWVAMLVSLAIVIVLPQPHGIRALIASTILRLIFSVGLEPTLFLLGAFNVSVCVSYPSPLPNLCGPEVSLKGSGVYVALRCGVRHWGIPHGLHSSVMKWTWPTL